MIIDYKCAMNRRVKECNQCLRYKYCLSGEPMPLNNLRGCARIGFGIIADVCLEYQRAYRNGAKGKKEWCEKWLRSERPIILSAEQYDGVALLQAMERKCLKKYGSFEDVYNRVQLENNQKLQKLLAELKRAGSRARRKTISEEIAKVRSILNA